MSNENKEVSYATVENLNDVSKLIVIDHSHTVEDLTAKIYIHNNISGHYITDSINDWVRYTKDNAKPESSRVFIDQKNTQAISYIDFGTSEKPMMRKHVAHLNLQITKEWEAFQDLASGKRNQSELTNFVLDWGDFFVFKDEDGNEMSEMDVLKGFKSLKVILDNERITSLTSNKIELSSMEQSTVQSVDAKTVFSIDGEIEIYKHLPKQKVKALLNYSMDEKGNPIIRLRAIAVEKMLEMLNEQFRNALSIDLNAPVYVGSLKQF